MKSYLRAREAAPKLGYTVGSLLKACQAGRIPHIRVSAKKVLFDPDDLARFMESRKKEGRP